MEWKKNALWIAALIGMIIVGSAITATVGSIEEAQNILGTSKDLEEIGCKVHSIEKTASTQEEILSNFWEVVFIEEFLVNGKLDRIVMVEHVTSNSEELIKLAIEKRCQEAWTKAQTDNETVTDIRITTDANTNVVLNQIYKAATKTWENLTNIGLEQ